VAVVTGASRGIGRAIALRLAADGARVAVGYRRDVDAAREVVEAVEAVGGVAAAHAVDVTDPQGVDAFADEVLRVHAGVDILVHNAGIASRGLLVAETTREEVARLLEAHAIAPHQLTGRLLPSLRAHVRSDVVVVSSTEAMVHRPRTAPYVMAKAALEAMALVLAQEERANGVRVNIVAPGLVWTDMGERLVRATTGRSDPRLEGAALPLGRVCMPEDVAGAVAYLVSADGAYVTGQKLIVDGGSPDTATVMAIMEREG
jgi:NAD(P)-dependent dehydrogenase (short-subunit alcohol dehydrogenase family)